MKKSIIAASAASLALAAMPVVSTFATNAPTVQDSLEITIENTCKIERSGSVSGAVQNASWSLASETAPSTNTGTYTATLSAGEAGIVGISTFKVTCNDSLKGHSMTVATTGLGGLTTSVPQGTAAPTIGYSNTAVDGANAGTISGWNITTSANTDLGTTAGIISVTSGTGTVYANTKKNVSASEFTATYKVGTRPEQVASTYTGNAIYTLTYAAD